MDTSQIRSLLICVFYAASSTAISLVNKAVLSSFHFTGTFLLLASQQFGALVVMTVFKVCHQLNLGRTLLPEIPDFNLTTFRKSLFVSVLFVGNVGSAFVGLRIVDVPLFLCVRRLTTLCVLGAEYLLLNKVSPVNIRSSIGLIMVGAILAGYETLSANWIGYCFVMSNNILTAWLYTEQKKLCDDTKLSPFGLLYYNSLVALPLFLGLAYLLGEVDDFATFPHRDNANWQAGVLVSSLLGVVMTYSIVLCNSVNSPLATSVTGNIKDIVGTALGWMVFGGFVATVASVSGLIVSFIGSGWYSYIKLMEKKPCNSSQPVDAPPVAPKLNSTSNGSVPLKNDEAVNEKSKLLETGPRLRVSPIGTPLRGTPTKLV